MRAQLEAQRALLASAKSDLEDTKQRLAATRDDLKASMAECDQARSDCAAVEGRAGVKLSAAARHTVENAGLRQRRAELEAEVASAREEADRIQSEWDLTKQRLANAEQRCVFVYGWWWFGWCPFTGELLPRGGRRVAELKSENSELQHQSVELTRKATSLSHQLDRVTNPALPHECV